MAVIETDKLSLGTLYELSGLTQKEIAEATGMRQSYVGVMIKEADKLPKIRRVITEAVERRFGDHPAPQEEA